MKIGIGIDTGGTCTDAVVYRFTDKKILAYAKTHTTKDDLSRGIGRALERLPRELVEQAEVIALSTTLATNACVENKGGRAKLVLFGASPAVMAKSCENYGMVLDESVLMVNSETRTTGEIVEPPDWDAFDADLEKNFETYEAAGIVELFAKKTGAVLEQEASKRIRSRYDIPIVCGNELFTEYNIIKRGASTLLNARLISIIEAFTDAVKTALANLNIQAPFVIVRSDGSLMTEKFAKTHPIETLLCGPVASVMGAAELTDQQNCMIIDMGGTTTDIAFVKDGEAKKVNGGVHIGKWNTFVKGLFVDTFGLGGDSGVLVRDNQEIVLEDEKVMPLSMVAHRFPQVIPCLKQIAEKPIHLRGARDSIYLTLRDIAGKGSYSQMEHHIAALLLGNPLSLEELGNQLGVTLLPSQIERLIREGVIIRCGVTPTDAMHCLGDFTKYDVTAAQYGIEALCHRLNMDVTQFATAVYDAVKKKLYSNIVRIMLEDAYPKLSKDGMGEQLEFLISQSYDSGKQGQKPSFFHMDITTPATLVGVGAPTHIFLEDVGKLLGTKVVISEYSQVANALGAVVGNVCAQKTAEVTLNTEDGYYTVFGCGQRYVVEDLEQAKALAKTTAVEGAKSEAILRGASQDTSLNLEEQEDIVETKAGDVFLGYRVTAVVSGQLDLQNL